MSGDAPLTVPPGFSRAPDPEIEAIGACLRVLLPLDAAARSRVLDYLDDRLKPGGAPEGDSFDPRRER